MSNNYTLGRGKLYFAPFAPGTQTPQGERYIGNTPEISIAIEEEKLDHYNSDSGVREKDDSISLQVNRTGSFNTDHISAENLALFFFGSVSALAVTGATVTDEEIASVSQGLYYQLGASDANPSGARELDLHSTGPDVNILVEEDIGVDPETYVEGTDYEIDMELGRLYIIPGGNIADGTSLLVSYKTKTTTRERIISGNTAIEGQLRYVADNPKGTNRDMLLPWATISPNGDYALKGDEWQVIPFTLEILKKTGLEAVYIDGRAVVSA